jgi:integrase/recombinase XerD
MPTIPLIEIFVRHNADCERQGDERWKRCNCRKHLRWSWQGKQYRRSAKTRSWAAAERAKRELELKYEKAQLSKPVDDDKVATVEEAIAAFMADKRGGKAALASLSKYKLTLSRFQQFCDRNNLQFIQEIRLEHLSQWRAEWQKYYGSAFALRNNQSRVRHFFRYCKRARMIDDNPAADLSAIKVTDDDFEVNPFTEKEYKVILKAIPACDDISALNRARVAALMQLQRWSGLSLVDAVCLSRAELVKAGTRYSIDTSRRKTGSKISNVIPAWLGQLLLELKNANASYFVWSGESTTKSATGVYDKLYRKVFRQAGIVDGGSHRFRHLFAVSLLEKGVDIRLVSKALGHKSLAITERYYARWSKKQQTTLDSALSTTWSSAKRA